MAGADQGTVTTHARGARRNRWTTEAHLASRAPAARGPAILRGHEAAAGQFKSSAAIAEHMLAGLRQQAVEEGAIPCIPVLRFQFGRGRSANSAVTTRAHSVSNWRWRRSAPARDTGFGQSLFVCKVGRIRNVGSIAGAAIHLSNKHFGRPSAQPHEGSLEGARH